MTYLYLIVVLAYNPTATTGTAAFKTKQECLAAIPMILKENSFLDGRVYCVKVPVVK